MVPESMTKPKLGLRRLMKEFSEIINLMAESPEPMFAVELVNDNLYEWNIRLFAIDPDSQLAKDMENNNILYILLNVLFPDDFPFSPPFMRVVEPQIVKGFVMSGGAICMELLTPRGWAVSYTVEALIMQFAASVVKGNGRICTTKSKQPEFTKENAEKSFKNLVITHERIGWNTPSLADG